MYIIFGNEALFINIYIYIYICSLEVAREQGYICSRVVGPIYIYIYIYIYKIPHAQVKQHIKYVHIHTYVAMRRHKLRIILGSKALRRLPTQNIAKKSYIYI